MAVVDFDNDGDLDIVIANLGGAPLLLRNDGGNRNHALRIRARGRESNRFGIGAKVRASAGGRTMLREVNPHGSYMSTSDHRLYIGIGGEVAASRLEIEWPGGKKQLLENVAADTEIVLDERNAR